MTLSQKIQRKPAPTLNGPPTPPTMNPPSMAAPQLPPSQKINSGEAPISPQYRREPEVVVAAWQSPAAPAYPASVPDRSAEYVMQNMPELSREGVYQAIQAQPYDSSAGNAIYDKELPSLQQYREEANYDSRLLPQQNVRSIRPDQPGQHGQYKQGFEHGEEGRMWQGYNSQQDQYVHDVPNFQQWPQDSGSLWNPGPRGTQNPAIQPPQTRRATQYQQAPQHSPIPQIPTGQEHPQHLQNRQFMQGPQGPQNPWVPPQGGQFQQDRGNPGGPQGPQSHYAHHGQHYNQYSQSGSYGRDGQYEQRNRQGQFEERGRQVWFDQRSGQGQFEQSSRRSHSEHRTGQGRREQIPGKSEKGRDAQHSGSIPNSPKPASQDSSTSPPPILANNAVEPQGISSHTSPLVPRDFRASHVTQQPPVTRAPRSTSQPSTSSEAHRTASPPVVQHNVRKSSPRSNRLHKASQPDIKEPQLPRSPDVSPRNSPLIQSRGRSESLVAPPIFGDISTTQSSTSRPNSYHSTGSSPDGRVSRRRSWLPGGKSRQASQDLTAVMNGPGAWVIGGHTRISYNVQLLENAEKVPELWDDIADTFVYLFPQDSRRPPSFRIPSEVISSSPKLRALAFGDLQVNLHVRRRAKSFDGRSTLAASDATRQMNTRKPNTPPYTPTIAAQDNRTSSDGSAESMNSLGETTREGHLYFPFPTNKTSQTPEHAAQEEHDQLLSVRNLFAFLTGRPLVATKNSPTVFTTLCLIANQLKTLGFSNADGSTYGEVVSSSLGSYIESMGLADMANSREKTLEGIVLGERLRSIELYNDAFTHAVGKYEAIKDIKSPIWDMVTPDTRNRLERAFMDLNQRQHSVQLRLNDFDFPSLFAGSAASTSTAASKIIRFKAWKSSFASMRKHVLSYYKDQHGDWPPKAKSKKNNFAQSGLNRLVLKELYADFCNLYDLLVDRESLTTHSMDVADAFPEGEEELAATALRRIESEYDRSSPPVQPPVPFDVPKLPTMSTLDPRHDGYTPKVRQQAGSRKLQAHEAILVLTKSHNLDSDLPTSFLKAFHAFEEKEAKSKTIQELTDQRFGHWLFTYVVLQALPMVVIDAPGLQHTEGVEYFLCQPPKGGAPWIEDASLMRMAWYGVAGSSGVVALPSDIVDHGVEAVYRRSHCWVAAEKWLEAGHGPPDIDFTPEDLGLNLPNGNQISVDLPPPEVIIGPDHDFRHGRLNRPLSVVAEGTPSGRHSRHDPDALSPTGMHPHSSHSHSHAKQRSRSMSSHRRSIAFGLEQLPVPAGYLMTVSGGSSNARVSPPLGTEDTLSPLSAAAPVGMVAQSAAGVASIDAGPVKGFDEILNSLEAERGDGKREKERGRRKSYIGLSSLVAGGK